MALIAKHYWYQCTNDFKGIMYICFTWTVKRQQVYKSLKHLNFDYTLTHLQQRSKEAFTNSTVGYQTIKLRIHPQISSCWFISNQNIQSIMFSCLENTISRQ